MNGPNYLKIPSNFSALSNIENDDKDRFFWSILASPPPCKKSHANRNSKCRQYFIVLNIQTIHFSDRFERSDVQKFENSKYYL